MSTTRTVLKPLLLIVGIILLAAFVLLIVSVVVNRYFDAPITPQTQAWLDYPSPNAPDARNGYLALVALDSRADQPIQAAAQALQAYRQVFATPYEQRTNRKAPYAGIEERLLKPAELTFDALPHCKDDCYAQIVAQPELFRQQAKEHTALLERYKAMLAYPEFAETIPLDLNVPLPRYSPARQLGLLYLAQAVQTLDSGDAATAYQDWARRQQFWQRAGAGSVSLINTLIAVAELERGHQILQGMLHSHPESVAIASQYILPVISKRPSLIDTLSRSIVHEFQMAAHLVTHQLAGRDLLDTSEDESDQAAGLPGGWKGAASRLMMQPNATINLFQQAYEGKMARSGLKLDGQTLSPHAELDELCQQPPMKLVTAPNPVGKILVCIDGPDFSRYADKVRALEKQDALLQQALTPE